MVPDLDMATKTTVVRKTRGDRGPWPVDNPERGLRQRVVPCFAASRRTGHKGQCVSCGPCEASLPVRLLTFDVSDYRPREGLGVASGNDIFVVK